MKMCNGCVKEEYPDRDNVCLEEGAYFLNFVGCSQCHGRDVLLAENRVKHEDEDEETITYDHVCKECLHLIASHTYKFHVEEEFQSVLSLRNKTAFRFFQKKELKVQFLHKMVPARGADEYEMSCMLCGSSEDTRSIMPYDPRQQPLFI